MLKVEYACFLPRTLIASCSNRDLKGSVGTSWSRSLQSTIGRDVCSSTASRNLRKGRAAIRKEDELSPTHKAAFRNGSGLSLLWGLPLGKVLDRRMCGSETRRGCLSSRSIVSRSLARDLAQRRSGQSSDLLPQLFQDWNGIRYSGSATGVRRDACPTIVLRRSRGACAK